MIIQSSEINTSAEHQKSVSRTFSSESSMNLDGSKAFLDSNQKDSPHNQFNQLFADFRNQMGNQGSLEEGEAQENSPSILLMTKEGYKFKTPEDQDSPLDQALMTSIKLFRRLLEALAIQDKDQFNTDIEAIESMLDEDCCNPTEKLNLGENLPGIFVQMTLNTTETIEEHESLSFNSTGTISTSDGKDISFALDMNIERDYSYTSISQSTQTIQFKDPLVINYPGSSAELSNGKYLFDIDADGNEDLISYFSSGAMLALDKNEDGIINDGSELFGALSGNGFADLASYDEDGNNFIDEADSIFKDLKLWTKTEDTDLLSNLASQDIGAIYLGATDTSFDLKGPENQFNGQVKASSFYLTEAGEAGYIQQVDMVV